MQTLNPPWEHFSTSIKITIFTLLLLSISLLLFSNPFSFSSSTSPLSSLSLSLPISPPPQLPPQLVPILSQNGIINEDGFMSNEFNVGDIVLLGNETREYDVDDGKKKEGDENGNVKIEKYKLCDESLSEIIPCLDNFDVINKLNLTDNVKRFDRHCPEMGKRLDCYVPKPKGYRERIPWPQSRSEVIITN